jgi:vacuolar-type H+-ATPase subunit H
VPEASNAAARLLEIATRNADELVDDAKNEADQIVGEARTKAERLESESKAKADRLEADARTARRCSTPRPPSVASSMFGDLEKERDKLNSEVENLRRSSASTAPASRATSPSSSRLLTAARPARSARSTAPKRCARSSARTTAEPVPALLTAVTTAADPSGSAARRISASRV